MGTQDNSGLRDLTASLFHRILGTNAYATDLDVILFANGLCDSSWIEHNFMKSVAGIDYKRMNANCYFSQDLADSKTALNFQSYHYQHELKTPLPFFIVLTYLSEEWEYKCYYVIPFNEAAFLILKENRWMTVKGFSCFQHQLRHLPFNENSKCTHNDANLTILGFPPNMILKDLPNTLPSPRYPLPTLLNYQPTIK